MKTVPRTPSSILSEDPGCDQQVSYQMRPPPNSAQKQTLETLDEQLRRIRRLKQSRPSEIGHYRLQQLRHSSISKERGLGCLCSLRRCESEAPYCDHRLHRSPGVKAHQIPWTVPCNIMSEVKRLGSSLDRVMGSHALMRFVGHPTHALFDLPPINQYPALDD